MVPEFTNTFQQFSHTLAVLTNGFPYFTSSYQYFQSFSNSSNKIIYYFFQLTFKISLHLKHWLPLGPLNPPLSPKIRHNNFLEEGHLELDGRNAVFGAKLTILLKTEDLYHVNPAPGNV